MMITQHYAEFINANVADQETNQIENAKRFVFYRKLAATCLNYYIVADRLNFQ